jgi:hypothetical protein
MSNRIKCQPTGVLYSSSLALECLHVWEHLFIHSNHAHVTIVKRESQNGQAVITLQVLHLYIVSVVDIAKLFVHVALLLLLLLLLLLITLQFTLNTLSVGCISNTG